MNKEDLQNYERYIAQWEESETLSIDEKKWIKQHWKPNTIDGIYTKEEVESAGGDTSGYVSSIF